MHTPRGKYNPHLYFSYFISPEGKHYLENITESVNGKVYAFIDMDYSNYQALRVTQK